jgi:hypothetical protein
MISEALLSKKISEEVGDYPVIGSAPEKHKVHEALKRVAELGNKNYFTTITRYYGYIVRVRNGSGSGVDPGLRSMIINDHEANAFSTTTGSARQDAVNKAQSLDVLAGTIYRYSYLGDLYIKFGYKHSTYAKDHPGLPVPLSAWDSEAIKRRAAEMEVQLLHALGATRSTLILAKRLAYHTTLS